METQASATSQSKERIRKCLLRYVDNILCLDDIQGVVSLHQLGLLPREDMNSYLDGSSGGAKNEKHNTMYSPSKGHPRRSVGSLEDQMEMPGWDFLEGMLSGAGGSGGRTEEHLPIQSLCASLTGMAVEKKGVGSGTGGAVTTMGPPPRGTKRVKKPKKHPSATTTTTNQIPPVNVNARNADGESALTFALKNEQLEMIQILVEKGRADVNMQNKDGNTELMMAARRGQTKMVRLLVEGLGANVHLRNKEGMTALMVAEKYERAEIVRFLSGAVLGRNAVLRSVNALRSG